MYNIDSATVGPKPRYFIIWNILGLIMIGLVVYLSLTPVLPKMPVFPLVDKLEHLFSYSVLMGWFSQLYLNNKQQIIWASGFCLMGIALEFIQGWGGHRYFEYADMMANTAGVGLGWWLSRGWCAGWLTRIDQLLSRR